MATTNTARQFQELMAESPTMTGTVTAHNADGTSTVSMTGGGVLIALGQTVAINSIAYIKNQLIIGESQALTVYNLEV